MRRDRGFSLLELLVVVTISAGLIILLSLLYRNIRFTGEALRSTESDGTVELFMRKQLLYRDERFDALGLFQGAPDDVRFITRFSARYGNAGPPVYAHYRYDGNDSLLVYEEVDMPPWWIDDADIRLDSVNLEYKLLDEAWKTTVFKAIGGFSFYYRGAADPDWRDSWRSLDSVPRLVKMDYSRLGQQTTLVMETQGLSFSLQPIEY